MFIQVRKCDLFFSLWKVYSYSLQRIVNQDRLLRGNTKTAMIANIGPTDFNYDESLSTLSYAGLKIEKLT